jgi:DNA-directed RNA polymerase specialized sigma24 family protein
MSEDVTADTLTGCVAGLRTGDASSIEELLRHARRRLRAMVRRMFPRHDVLHRWVDTGDVLGGAERRLRERLERARPADLRQFIALSAAMIRQELVALGREHLAAGEATAAATDQATTDLASGDPDQTTAEPSPVARSEEFHRRVDALPGELREVVDSLWYHDLPAGDVAQMLGVPAKTLNRRWREARVFLGGFLRT